MSKKLPDIKTSTNRAHDDNPEWRPAEFKKAVRSNGLPQSLQEKLRARCDPKKALRKVKVTVR